MQRCERDGWADRQTDSQTQELFLMYVSLYFLQNNASEQILKTDTADERQRECVCVGGGGRQININRNRESELVVK